MKTNLKIRLLLLLSALCAPLAFSQVNTCSMILSPNHVVSIDFQNCTQDTLKNVASIWDIESNDVEGPFAQGYESCPPCYSGCACTSAFLGKDSLYVFKDLEKLRSQDSIDFNDTTQVSKALRFDQYQPFAFKQGSIVAVCWVSNPGEVDEGTLTCMYRLDGKSELDFTLIEPGSYPITSIQKTLLPNKISSPSLPSFDLLGRKNCKP